MSAIDEPYPIIEINDSSEESEQEDDTALASERYPSPANKSSSPDTAETVEATVPIDPADSGCTSKDVMTKRLASRRKSMHQSRKVSDNLAFDAADTRPKRSGSEEIIRDTKKQKLLDDEDLDAAIEGNFYDPDMDQVLRKIAYCRVFSNYLLRQYNMLTIDFKLYSNIDLLMLELKKRVETYTSIRKSRLRLRENALTDGRLK